MDCNKALVDRALDSRAIQDDQMQARTHVHQFLKRCETRSLCSRRETAVDMVARIVHVRATVTTNVSNTVDLRNNAITAT